MKKNSIFSREYEKKLRRKRFAILTIVLIFFTVLVYYIINFSKFNNYVKNVYYSHVNNEVLKHSADNSKLVENVVDSSEENESDILKEEIENLNENVNYYEVILEENLKVHIPYKKEKDTVEFDLTDIEKNNTEFKNYNFDISPSKNKILIDDIKNKNAYMLNDKFELFKLDPEFFYSNSAASRFYEKDVLEDYKNYLWYSTPRFLDDNTIVYVSNLPWFGKDEQYIWKTDVSNTSDIRHFMTSVAGGNIVFEELTEEGIKVIINNEIKLLTFSFVLK